MNYQMFLAVVALLCLQVVRHVVHADPLAVRMVDDLVTFKQGFFDDDDNDPFFSLVAAPEEEHWFQQRIDHLGFYRKTFRQLYYVNDTYYRPGGPVYLYCPGESANKISTVKSGFLLNLAEATNGLVVSLEHRYYGRSNPVPDLSPRNMRYLSVAQALADMAHFIETAELPQIEKNRADVRWIVVGGSYAANLAVWMRLKYPDLVYAAYSSSGPVRAKYDFYEYDLMVGRRLPCADAVAEAVRQIDEVLYSGDESAIRDLKTAFGLEALERPADFAGALVDQMTSLVQYYAPPVANKTDAVADYCAAFNLNDNMGAGSIGLVESFAALTKRYLAEKKVKVLETYDTYRNANNYTLDQSGRAWFYQTCTEFAYWQTAPPTSAMRSLRSRLVDIDYNEAPCRAYFGAQVSLPVDVSRINRQYHGDQIEVTRVYYVNGEFDPWRYLSVSAPTAPPRAPTTPDVHVRVIPGGSHCYDLRRPTDTDWDELKEIRADIIRTFREWLSQKNTALPEQDDWESTF
ncbi:hypothetical protein IWQ60_009253 [Tieghemiomyces parasiticus]|uniref:Uncharacterized protein n=1 Tax=Tieghemiomyces parasiticus TaxID=78921 RepID=A0A9W7ZPU3_9FUNG|nr:hypothetical protein IWQ60_009253 [Tieghemiomyces parasiticus]